MAPSNALVRRPVPRPCSEPAMALALGGKITVRRVGGGVGTVPPAGRVAELPAATPSSRVTATARRTATVAPIPDIGGEETPVATLPATAVPATEDTRPEGRAMALAAAPRPPVTAVAATLEVEPRR